jgi:hypothetical protein
MNLSSIGASDSKVSEKLRDSICASMKKFSKHKLLDMSRRRDVVSKLFSDESFISCCTTYRYEVIQLNLQSAIRMKSDVKELAALFANPSVSWLRGLNKLDVSNNSMDDKSCANLLRSLAENTVNLSTLILNGNVVGAESAEVLSKWLADPNCKLVQLQLRNCTMGISGPMQRSSMSPLEIVTSSIASANYSLEVLDVSGNGSQDNCGLLAAVTSFYQFGRKLSHFSCDSFPSVDQKVS